MKENGSRYPIAAVRERVRQRSGPILDFVLGRHREAPPNDLTRLLAEHDPRLLTTPSERGHANSVALAAAAMVRQQYGIDMSPEEILPVPGGRTAMSLLATTLIRREEAVLIFDPAYPAFERVALQLGAQVHTVSLDPDRGLAPDLESVRQSGNTQIRFAALNYPNNPTGAIISPDDLTTFLESLSPGTIVFNDATYGPLTFRQDPWSLLARSGAAGEKLRLLELHSLAKFFSLGPVPVSFLIGDADIIEELREFSEFAWSDQSQLHVQVALLCLQDGAHLAAIRETFRHRMKRLTQTLEDLGFEPFHPESGMYVVCRVPRFISGQGVGCAGEAAEILLEKHALAVVPWEVEPHEYLRFSGQYSDEDIQGLAALGRNGKLVTG